MGIRRVIGSTRLHNLAARRIVFNSSGNKPVGIHDKMGMKFASNFNGALVVNSQLLKLVKGVLSVAGPTNIQKDVVESHILDFSQVHVPLVNMELVRLSHTVGCCGPQCGAVSAAQHMMV
eukprot:1093640-Pelagomonas_calceolata.AAC.1